MFQHRKPLVVKSQCIGIATLQWSRCVSTPETAAGLVTVNQDAPLQWSRCVSTPETAISHGHLQKTNALQWSRCVSTPETTKRVDYEAEQIRASMEPVCFNTGNGLKVITVRPRSPASMEPVCFNTGNQQEGTKVRALTKSLQWSRCVSTPETVAKLKEIKVGTAASMEPVCFNTGNSKRTYRDARKATASMEPVCFNTGNLAVAAFEGCDVPALQWSRCVSTPETEMSIIDM